MGPAVSQSPCLSFLVTPPQLTTGYWDFRGLGAPMRMMCVYTQVQWKDVKYTAQQKERGGWVAPEWERNDRPPLRDMNPLVQLPYVRNHATGEVVSQSTAVYLYLGRILGLAGDTWEEQLANEQVLAHLHSMWSEVRDLVYPSGAKQDQISFELGLKAHFATALPAHYGKLENWLRHRGTLYFAGRKPRTADFHVWEMLDQQEALARVSGFPSPIKDVPLLQVFYLQFRALPQLQAYFDGPDFQLPMNNKMAFFK